MLKVIRNEQQAKFFCFLEKAVFELKYRVKYAFLIITFLVLQGCNKEPDEEWVSAAYALGLNHTKNSIIRFELSTGASGRVPPYGGSGIMMGGGSYPKVWRPDFTVEVNWTVDTNPFDYLPFNHPQYREKMDENVRLHQTHSATVVPWPYGEDTCGVTVHFLPCNEVAIQYACHDENDPANGLPRSIKEMEDPDVCP